MSNTIWENICNTLYWRICLMGDIIYNRNFTGKQQRWSRIWTNCRNSVEWWRCESDSCRKWITGSQNVSGETGRLFWRNSDGYHDACNGWDYCDKNNPVTETSRCWDDPDYCHDSKLEDSGLASRSITDNAGWHTQNTQIFYPTLLTCKNFYGIFIRKTQ